MTKTFLTPQEYAAATGQKLATVWRHLRAGTLPALPRRAGQRLWFIPASALEPQTADAPPVAPVSNVTDLQEFRERKASL